MFKGCWLWFFNSTSAHEALCIIIFLFQWKVLSLPVNNPKMHRQILLNSHYSMTSVLCPDVSASLMARQTLKKKLSERILEKISSISQFMPNEKLQLELINWHQWLQILKREFLLASKCHFFFNFELYSSPE